MKLGFCTGLSEESIKFAADAGFMCLEIFAGGDLIDPNTTTKDKIKKARALLDQHGIAASTVFHYEDYAAPDEAASKKAWNNLKKTMDIAEGLGTSIVTCNAWVPGSASLADKFKFYKKSFSTFAKWFEDRGMKLAIENCPHDFHNISWNVANWEVMFNEVPSEAIGLEYDPSHLVWQQIDYLAALRKFASRIYAFHAKDTQVLRDVVSVYGMNGGKSWWRFRVPGYGDVCWKSIFQILSDIDYKGDMVIEHEDPVFDGPRRQEGLKLGLKCLETFVVQQ